MQIFVSHVSSCLRPAHLVQDLALKHRCRVWLWLSHHGSFVDNPLLAMPFSVGTSWGNCKNDPPIVPLFDNLQHNEQKLQCCTDVSLERQTSKTEWDLMTELFSQNAAFYVVVSVFSYKLYICLYSCIVFKVVIEQRYISIDPSLCGQIWGPHRSKGLSKTLPKKYNLEAYQLI